MAHLVSYLLLVLLRILVDSNLLHDMGTLRDVRLLRTRLHLERTILKDFVAVVYGSVYNQNSFLYRGGKKLGDYLSQAGGPTRDADKGSIYLVKADGSVISKRQGSMFGSFEGQKVMPGDAIVVPEDFDKFRWTKELKDWSQIFYQFALGVAGLKVLSDL